MILLYLLWALLTASVIGLASLVWQLSQQVKVLSVTASTLDNCRGQTAECLRRHTRAIDALDLLTQANAAAVASAHRKLAYHGFTLSDHP